MAGLLGCRRGTKVSRYERYARRPTLETVLAYEAVFGVPARELCAGIFGDVQEVIAKRAAALAAKLAAGPQGVATTRKLDLLRRVASKAGTVARAA